jgi:hypothetical protein
MTSGSGNMNVYTVVVFILPVNVCMDAVYASMNLYIHPIPSYEYSVHEG